jgi:hypothetical protein
MIKWIYPFVYVCVCLVLLLHAASPTGLVSRTLPTSVEVFTGLALVILSILYRIAPPDKRFVRLAQLQIPVVAGFGAIAARVTELLTYSNFVFSYTHLDPTALSLLSLFALSMYVTTLGKEAFKQRPDRAIALFGLWMTHLILLKYYNYGLYNNMSGEDKFFEWLTFVIYLIGGLVFAKVVMQLLARKKKTLLVVLLLLYSLFGAIGYCGIAGEEVSWGQRLVHFKTPERYIDYNSQGEFNLHNNEKIFNKIYHIYGLVSLYALVSPVFYMALKRWIKKPIPSTFVRILTFRWYHGVYFVPTLIYVAYRIYYQTSAYDIWEESTEALFATGMMLYAAHVYWVVKKSVIQGQSHTARPASQS